MDISTLNIFDTIYNADSIEWCPHEPYQNVFVCANYQLIEATTESECSKRFGKIRLFTIEIENLNDTNLKQYQVIDTDAILDQKWCHNQIDHYSILAVAYATNKLELYRFDTELLELVSITFIQGSDTNILLLSLDWSTGKCDQSIEPEIVTSDSDGCIQVINCRNECKLLECKSRWKAHSFESWICAFYYWNPSILFTGGDDCKLLKFDLRTGTEPLLQIKTHTAGVTALHSNKDKEFLLASGSYDSNLLLWDIRNMKLSLSALTMPGCVWRLKWHPFRSDYLLAACMKDGFHIVRMLEDNALKVVGHYYEHEDLAYGVDWSYLQVKSNQLHTVLFGACSFYDHKLSVAKAQLLPDK